MSFTQVYMTHCHLMMTHFPFDNQTCPLEFMLWDDMTNQTELRLFPSSDNNTAYYVENNTWKLKHFWGVNLTFVDEVDMPHDGYVAGSRKYVKYWVHVKRKSIADIFIFYFPNLMMNILTTAQFFLPSEMLSKRLTLGSTLIFMNVFFMILLQKKLPYSHDAPTLAQYLAITSGMVTLGCVGSIFHISCHYYADGKILYSLQPFYRKFFLHFIAKLVFAKHYITKDEVHGAMLEKKSSRTSVIDDRLMDDDDDDILDDEQLILSCRVRTSLLSYTSMNTDIAYFPKNQRMSVRRPSLPASCDTRSRRSSYASYVTSHPPSGVSHSRSHTHKLSISSNVPPSVTSAAFGKEEQKRPSLNPEVVALRAQQRNSATISVGLSGLQHSGGILKITPVESNLTLPRQSVTFQSPSGHHLRPDTIAQQDKNDDDTHQDLESPHNDEDVILDDSMDKFKTKVAASPMLPSTQLPSSHHRASDAAASRQLSLDLDGDKELKAYQAMKRGPRLSLAVYGPCSTATDEIISKASSHTSLISSNVSGARSPVSMFTRRLTRDRCSEQLSLIRLSNLATMEDDIVFQVLKHVQTRSARIVEQDRAKAANNEWKQLAYVLDRMVGFFYLILTACFWLWLIVVHNFGDTPLHINVKYTSDPDIDLAEDTMDHMGDHTAHMDH